MDEVQLQDRGFQHRNLFLDKHFEQHLLTVPIEKKFYRQQKLKELKTANNFWQRKHLHFFQHNYNHHPFYEEIMESILPLYQQNYTFLIDFLESNLRLNLQLFQIDTQLVLQSELNYQKDATKCDLILDLLKQVNASQYLSGTGAKHYQNDEEFAAKKIELLYQNYKQTPYKQYKADRFHEGLSSLDLLFNIGQAKAKLYI